ncbi:hypothetical protein MY4824_008881 [Beauveria thailandica]
MAPKLNVKIESLSYADIDACAEILRDTFAIDPRTIVKQLGRDGYDMHRMARRGYLGNPERKTMVLVKAVDVDVGSIVGYGRFAFPNVKQASIPWIGPADAKPQEQGPKSEAGDKVTREPGQTLKPERQDSNPSGYCILI